MRYAVAIFTILALATDEITILGIYHGAQLRPGQQQPD